TLGDLAARSSAELSSGKRMGRETQSTLIQAISTHLARVREALPVASAPGLDAGAEDERWAQALSSIAASRAEERRTMTDTGLLESWRALLSTLPLSRRMVIERRAGLGGHPEKLSEIGDAMGRSRERMRQLEEDALGRLAREEVWLAQIRRRVSLA